jgi:hypothetical protein
MPLGPLDHWKVLEPPAAVAFDPKAFSIVGDAAQRALFPGIVLRKLVPDRWLVQIVGIVHGQILSPGRSPSRNVTLASDPDIKDMFRFSYPRGAPATAPAWHFDPGRARNENFFRKIYGDCSKPEFSKTLTQITWLPGKTRQKLVVTTVNGVAEKLKAISSELDALPARFDEFLVPSAGAFICRHIAGTDQRSAHGYGIAVDIALKRSHYWRWDSSGSDRALRYRNDTPPEIVRIFENRGFIWGGRWSHYDTMHFEYRPELIEP